MEMLDAVYCIKGVSAILTAIGIGGEDATMVKGIDEAMLWLGAELNQAIRVIEDEHGRN